MRRLTRAAWSLTVPALLAAAGGPARIERAGPGGGGGLAAPPLPEETVRVMAPGPTLASALAGALPLRDASPQGDPVPPHAFYFTRAAYGGGGDLRGWGRRRNSWATDFPKADHQFLVVLNRLVDIDAYEGAHPMELDDPALRRFPFLYALEVGYMNLDEAEVQGLRDYLEAGGFLVIDDFWGTAEWANFERQIRRVLPGRPIVELGLDHPLFSTFYDIDEIWQVPGIGRGVRGGPTWERDGYTPHVRGIFDDDGRLMVVINFNTDLGDAWEWAEDPFYPLKYSTYAIEMGVNMIVYAMSH